MKSNDRTRSIAVTLIIVMTFMLISPTLAAANYKGIDEKPISQKKLSNVKATILASIKNQDNKKEFSPEELEQMRSALLDLLNANQELSMLMSPQSTGKVKSDGSGEQDKGDDYDDVRKQIQNMSGKDLTALRLVLNPSKMQAKLANSRAAFREFKNITTNSPGLPGIDSFCGGPVPTGVIIAADVVYFLAEAVRDIAQDGCNEVAVVLGFGGNVRLVCLITDAIYIIAKALNQAVHFCDDDYAASVGQASYDRLGHIHDDLEGSVANDNTNYTNIIGNATTNTTTITTAVTNAKNTIVNNDNANKDTIIINDNTNKTTIVNNDNANKTTIVNNDNANTAALTALVNAALLQIISNANDNKDETKNLLLRTQIEADLSSTDGSTFVALYETPTNVCLPSLNDRGLIQIGILTSPIQCGLLDLVRSIVRDTIANVGFGTGAQAFFVTGDQQRAAGQYKAAYASYRKAYKAASK